MKWLENHIKEKYSNNILNNFINLLIISVADEYLLKLKKDKKNPPIEIQKFLNQSVKLTKKKVYIKKIMDKVVKRNAEETIKFKEVVENNKDYKDLVLRFNFALALTQEEKLQQITLKKLLEPTENESIRKQKIKENNFNWIKKLNFNRNNEFNYLK